MDLLFVSLGILDRCVNYLEIIGFIEFILI